MQLFMLAVKQEDAEEMAKLLPNIQFVPIFGQQMAAAMAICTPVPAAPQVVAEDAPAAPSEDLEPASAEVVASE